MNNYSIAKEFGNYIIDKLDDNSFVLVIQELEVFLANYEIVKKTYEVSNYTGYLPECYKLFFISKKIEGLSEDTLSNYDLILNRFFQDVSKPLSEINPNDIRVYLYQFQKNSTRPCSDVYLNNIRVVLNGFFNWCVDEDYISKNPCKPIKSIHCETKPREPLTDIEMELVRHACDNYRDIALVEFLYSTGCRVSEVANLKISDIDFERKEVQLFGKGKKHRTSYINARAEIALRCYLATRKDNSPNLFVRLRQPHSGLTKAGIEHIIHELGVRAKINRNVYPHLIRHTTATSALNRGMNISELKELLGHEKMDTTLIYAKIAKNAVHTSHAKYIV